MRYVVSVLLLLASIVSFGLGVAQRTVWKPPSEITSVYSATTDASLRTVVIPNSVLQSHADSSASPTLEVQGQGTIIAVTGNASDIKAFIGSSKAAWLTTTDQRGVLKGAIRGADNTLPNPIASDLWRTTKDASKNLELETHRSNGLDLMVTTNAANNELESVALTWPMSDTNTPFAIPLFIAGTTFFVAGAIWYFLALRIGRRKRRPKRSKRMKRVATYAPSRHRLLTAGTGLGVGALLVVAMSGCATSQQSATQSATGTSGPSQATAPVSRAQFLTIMSRISSAADAGDASLSVKDLDGRFAGPALINRQAIYEARDKDSKVQKPTPVLAGPVKIVLPTVQFTFPRTIFTVVQDNSSGALPSALWLKQTTARSNYQVTNMVDLMPSVEFPELPSENAGATLVSAKAKGLAMTPANVATMYYEMVEDKKSTKFDTKHDQFVQTVRSHEAELKKSLGSKGAATYKRTVDATSIQAIRTASGGALVGVYVNDSETVKPAKSGGSIETEGTVKALLGKSATKKGYTATYGVMMLFDIPKSGHGKPALLGINQALVNVKEVS